MGRLRIRCAACCCAAPVKTLLVAVQQREAQRMYERPITMRTCTVCDFGFFLVYIITIHLAFAAILRAKALINVFYCDFAEIRFVIRTFS